MGRGRKVRDRWVRDKCPQCAAAHCFDFHAVIHLRGKRSDVVREQHGVHGLSGEHASTLGLRAFDALHAEGGNEEEVNYQRSPPDDPQREPRGPPNRSSGDAVHDKLRELGIGPNGEVYLRYDPLCAYVTDATSSDLTISGPSRYFSDFLALALEARRAGRDRKKYTGPLGYLFKYLRGCTSPLVAFAGGQRLYKAEVFTSGAYAHDILTALTSGTSALLLMPKGLEPLTMKAWSSNLSRLLPQKLVEAIGVDSKDVPCPRPCMVQGPRRPSVAESN